MNRQAYINSIVKYSARFVEEIKLFNSLGLYDINIHSESFYIPVLNEIFDLKLRNLNSVQKKNFPAIDLADFENRCAFQITSTSSFTKVKSTFEKFTKYNLHKTFDTIYFYFIAENNTQFSDDKLTDILPDGFEFSENDHILDNARMVDRIHNLSTEKIAAITDIYEREFSEDQISERYNKNRYGYFSAGTEELFVNMVKLGIPNQLYIADLDIDEDLIQQRINEWRISKDFRPIKKKLHKSKLIDSELAWQKKRCNDWFYWDGMLYTFRDLNRDSEPLNKIVDKGTITEIYCEDFYQRNDNTNRVFKTLLRNALIQDCYSKGLEWVRRKGIVRFRMDKDNTGVKAIRWKGKVEATKTVISEIRNKKEGHLIAFRHLAFYPTFEFIDDEWYMIINSTWSFTNPGGKKTSRFEKDYLSGIKRLENNQSVYNFFRFWAFYLRYRDLWSKNKSILEYDKIKSFPFSPNIEDGQWKPLREEFTSIETNNTILEKDDELTIEFDIE